VTQFVIALVVSKQNTREIICKLKDIKKPDEKDIEEPGEELCRKPSLIIKKIIKRNSKPIQISIWDRTK
jgi:hypothetical protein